MIRSDGTVRVRVGSEAKIGLQHGRKFLGYVGGDYIDFETSVEAIIKKLSEIKARYSDEYSDLQVEAFDDDGYRDCSCETSFRVMGNRKANQVEIDWYAAQEAERIATREAQERAEYERLKARFDK